MTILEYYPALWAFALTVWILQGVVCFKAFLMHRYADRTIWLGFLTMDIALFFLIATSFSLTLDTIEADPDTEPWRVAVRFIFPSTAVIASFVVHYIIRHRFKRFFKEEARWHDFL